MKRRHPKVTEPLCLLAFRHFPRSSFANCEFAFANNVRDDRLLDGILRLVVLRRVFRRGAEEGLVDREKTEAAAKVTFAPSSSFQHTRITRSRVRRRAWLVVHAPE
jgi:hypothetical protein